MRKSTSRRGVTLSLANNLTVKEDDNTTAHVFNKVDLPLNKTGTLRTNVDLSLPAKETLLIQSGPTGKGLNIADRHSITMDKIVVDSGGNQIRGYTTLSLNFPRSTAFTAQMMINLVHQLLTLIVSTASFDVDDNTVKSLLRGES